VKPPKSPVPHHEKESNGEHHKNHFGLLRPVRDSLEKGERRDVGGEREREDRWSDLNRAPMVIGID
jgi:hypothetical protein